MSANPPRKHHYVPAFYLKQWVGGDGQLCQYKKVHDGIAVNRKHPNATGFEVDLYRIETLPAVDAQAFEQQFMRYVDEAAYIALEKIKNDLATPWLGPMRSAWSRFLLSFLFRNPEGVAAIKTHILALWKEGIAALESEYARQRRPEDPPTLAEQVRLRSGEAAPHIGVATFIQGLIDNEQLGPVIFDMHWSLINLEKADHSLLASDRPLDMPLGLGNPDSYIALPIGPRKLFLASRKSTLELNLNRANPNEIVRKINLNTVSKARKYVWGVSDGQRSFVQRHIASASDRILITDQQRLDAVNAARGDDIDLIS